MIIKILVSTFSNPFYKVTLFPTVLGLTYGRLLAIWRLIYKDPSNKQIMDVVMNDKDLRQMATEAAIEMIMEGFDNDDISKLVPLEFAKFGELKTDE